LQLI